jgi:hypothetical protein
VPAIPLKHDGDNFPSDETILQWALDIRELEYKRGYYLTNNALSYWAKAQLNNDSRYSPTGDEMQYAALLINGLPDITRREVPVVPTA